MSLNTLNFCISVFAVYIFCFLCRLPFFPSKQFCFILPHLLLPDSIFSNLSSKWKWNLFTQFLGLQPSHSASVLFPPRRQEEESYGIFTAICYCSDEFTAPCTSCHLMDGFFLWDGFFSTLLIFNSKRCVCSYAQDMLYPNHANAHNKVQYLDKTFQNYLIRD